MNILITGTSSGFGQLAARSLALRGHRVFATMRRPDSKRTAALAGTEVLELDVTSDASVAAAVGAALDAAGHLDAVINNAGQAMIGLSETIAPAQLSALFDVNVIGMQRVNRAVLPSMRARKSGLIVHLSSSLGRWLMPVVGLYAATKWAVEALAETYRYDLKPCGIDVSIVQPGAYPTEFGSGSPFGADQDRATGYGALAGALDGFVQRMSSPSHAPGAPNPRDVADAIVKLVETPAGQRPARVHVDASGEPFTTQLNHAHAEVQRQLLNAMGLGALAD